MTITTAMIKELRERTGAGMMDCKKILTETEGNIELAIDELRKKGAAAAEKKAGRIAADGIIVCAGNDSFGVILEVNSETDFVAKDDSFKKFAADVADAVLNSDATDVEALGSVSVAGGTVEDARQELITRIGENISIRRFEKIAVGEGQVSHYLHGARIGVLVHLNDGSHALGRDIAMHIAASKPLCVSEENMPQEVLDKEKEIFIAQAAESGKSADIIEKMIGGRMKKFLKENTLYGQPFVKNQDQTVGELLKSENATVTQMFRFEVGEGIEKRKDDFVAEVMAQAAS
ncbi:MAG: elongation factor Ts [Gammaproteobacteria bacterium]|nr:elongation factor Ts [Gammaproteobacteria bacterium]